MVKQLKVLQVIDTLGMGGAETWLMEVLRVWGSDTTRNPQMDFLVTSGKAGFFDEEARQLGAKIFYAPFQRNHLINFAREFRRILSAGSYDAIHDHSDYVSGWHYFLGGSYLPSVRITHVHNPSYQIKNNYGVTFMRRLTAAIGKKLVARYATYIAGTSRQVLEEYGFYGSPFSCIPKGALHCGFRPERFLGEPEKAKTKLCEEFGWPTDSKIILFAGRMDQSLDPQHPQTHKNSGAAVEIGIECLKTEKKIRMIMAGSPRERVMTLLQQRITEAGCHGKIYLAGIRRDIAQLMLGSDVLLFPSRGEGLGMVAVEAQAAGTPVVASTAVPKECVVLPELVQFVPLTKSFKEWSEVVIRTIEHGRPETMSCNRRVADSEFAIKNSALRLQKVYKQGTS